MSIPAPQTLTDGSVVISQPEQMAYYGERAGYLEETVDFRHVGMVRPLGWR
jgi:hypothetical protein